MQYTKPHILDLDTNVSCDLEFASSCGRGRLRKGLRIIAREGEVKFTVTQGSFPDDVIVKETSSRVEAIEAYNALP